MVEGKQQHHNHPEYTQNYFGSAAMDHQFYHLEETREDPGHACDTGTASLHQVPRNNSSSLGWDTEPVLSRTRSAPPYHFQASSLQQAAATARDGRSQWEDPYHFQNHTHETNTSMNQSIWSTTSGGNNNDNNRNLQKIQGHPVAAAADDAASFYSTSTNQSSLAGGGAGVPRYHRQPNQQLSAEERSWYGSTSVGGSAPGLPNNTTLHHNSGYYKEDYLHHQNADTVTFGAHPETRTDDAHRITASMTQLKVSSSSTQKFGGTFSSNMNRSVASINTDNSTIPGLVGASSGSTGGGSISLATHYQQIHPSQIPGHQEHRCQQRHDLAAGNDPKYMSQQFYPSQYPAQQQGQQVFHRPPQVQGSNVPPGFAPQQQPQSSLGLAGSINAAPFQQHDEGDSFLPYDVQSDTGSASAGIRSSYHSLHEGGSVSHPYQQQHSQHVGAKKHGVKRRDGASGGRNVQYQQHPHMQGSAGGAGRRQVEHSPHRNQSSRKGRSKQGLDGGERNSNSSLQAALRREDRSAPTVHQTRNTEGDFNDGSATHVSSKASSEAIRMLMNPPGGESGSISSSTVSALGGTRLPLDRFTDDTSETGGTGPYATAPTDTRSAASTAAKVSGRPILPAMDEVVAIPPDIGNFDGYEVDLVDDEEEDEEESHLWGNDASSVDDTPSSPNSKKTDWLLRMNRRLTEIPVGELDPSVTPISAIMNAWAKTKSAHGAGMVETWLNRAQEEFDSGNTRVVPTNKMYTMAVDAWAKSGEGVSAAQRAEAILQHMHQQYQATGFENLRPTTGIFNAVINAWARSKEKIAPNRAEQILKWMDNLHRTNPSIRPDKYTFNTVIHAYAKSGGPAAAKKAQQLLNSMHRMYQQGNLLAKPDTITYNVVINSLAKSGGKEAAVEAEKLLSMMHQLHENGDPDVKPNVVTYGAVIDAYAKSGEKGAAARADALLAKMIHLHQIDPITNGDLRPNTYVFNTVINAHAKSKEHDAASKAEEMLLAMNRLHASGNPNLKPDAFTYTAVIDAWAKSGYRGAATRADQLLDTMEAKYLAGDMDLKPNTFTYNAVINALAKSGEPGAAARAERVLHNMVNRHKHGASEDVKPTTINFNSVLDAWAKSGGGRKAAERAEEILEWMDRLHKSGNQNVRPDTITFNAVLDAWARSGDRMAAHRAEQILDHMDELYRAGNHGVKPDTYTYNTLINAHAKSSEKGSAARAEHVLQVMKQRYMDGDKDFKPNTRTHTSVIDAWAKSGEKGAAKRAEQILNNMISSYEASGDVDIKPNVHTANAVCNACAFTKMDEDRPEALQIAFRVFDWLSGQQDMEPDAYTFTILLSVCSNLLPREDRASRLSHAKSFFEKCCESGHVNDYVLRKLRQTVSEQEYLALVEYRGMSSSPSNLPAAWTRKVGNKNRRYGNPSSVGSTAGRSKGGDGRWSSHSRRPGGSKY